MYRDKINELIKWKLSEYRKPLIVLGARQVGKTWLIQEFGRLEYKQTIYINFEKMKILRNLFVEDFDTSRILTALTVFAHKEIDPEDTLIVFDEIQEAEGGLTALKYFCEDLPRFHVIAAGSLLGLSHHQNSSFPVGKVDFLYLNPMSFSEFLIAINEEQMANLLINTDWNLITLFKEKFLTYLRYYIFIGGMPEVVFHFVEKRDFRVVRNTQNRILTAYQNDFSKHAPKEIVPRIIMVWKSIPSQLAKENKKFVYGFIKEGGRAKEFELAIQWLVNCGLIHQCFRVSKPAISLSAYQDLSAFKLYHNDVGLLAAMAKLPLQTILNNDAIFEEFKGSLTENYVFQQLLLKEENDIYYWTNENSTSEVDFIIQNDHEVIPIEVKSGINLKSVSFKFFCSKYNPKKAIRTSLADFKEEEWMTNIPLYAINKI
jgi:uncharacterized protein